jgi:hypothetical protein
MGLAVRGNCTQVKKTICLKMGEGDGAAVGGQLGQEGEPLEYF